jgi:type VI secretion system secreted protein VgrG
MAGKNWGWISLPRIGQEVIISFLEGNPDRPIITGRVYNGEQMPPYTLPTNQTQSGIKTRSSKEGTTENFNEIRFEDKKDSEEVYVHAEKDFNCVIENDETRKIGLDKKDKGNQTIEIHNDRSVTLNEGNDTLTVKKGYRLTDVDEGNNTLNVKKGNQETNVDAGNDTLTVKQGNHLVKVSAGSSSLETGTSIDQKAGTAISAEAGTALELKAGTTMSIEASISIELKVGSNSIKIDNTGITIKGLMVNIEGTAMTEVKSPITTVNASGMLTLKGSMTMIN